MYSAMYTYTERERNTQVQTQLMGRFQANLSEPPIHIKKRKIPWATFQRSRMRRNCFQLLRQGF